MSYLRDASNAHYDGDFSHQVLILLCEEGVGQDALIDLGTGLSKANAC